MDVVLHHFGNDAEQRVAGFRGDGRVWPWMRHVAAALCDEERRRTRQIQIDGMVHFWKPKEPRVCHANHALDTMILIDDWQASDAVLYHLVVCMQCGLVVAYGVDRGRSNYARHRTKRVEEVLERFFFAMHP